MCTTRWNSVFFQGGDGPLMFAGSDAHSGFFVPPKLLVDIALSTWYDHIVI